MKRQLYDENGVGTVTMFVLLLSFGLFFAMGGIKEKSPFTLDSDSFKPFSERIFNKEDNFKPTGFAGELFTDNPRIKEVFEKNTKVTAQTISPRPQVENIFVGTKNANYSLENVEEKFLDSPSSTGAEIKIEETSDEDVEMTEASEKPVLEEILMSNIKFEPNTTYLLCEKVKYLTPSSGEVEFNPDSPLKLSLFIASNENAGDYDDILEVTCQITDMSQRSLHRAKDIPIQQN